jgi:hypothetical protein
MGTGIMRTIPISFCFGSYLYSKKDEQGNKKEFTKHASKDFFDLDKCVEYFNYHTKCALTIFPYFMPIYMINCKNLLVYQDNYKSYMDIDSSFWQIRPLLWTVMTHLLAKVIKNRNIVVM